MIVRRWLVAAVVALAVPVAGYLLAGALDATIEDQWLAALEAEYGEIAPEAASDFTLAVLCQDPAFVAEVDGGCTDTAILGLLRGATIAAGGVAAVVLIVAGGTALVSRRNRRRMALLFRPALVVVLVGTAALVVLQAAILIGLLWEVMVIWVGYIWPWLLIVLGVAALAAVLGVVAAVPAMLKSQPLPIDGIPLDRAAEPGLFALIDRLAERVGTQPPDHVVTGLEPNFFVVDTKVVTADGFHTGRTMFLSAPLCRLLAPDELEAVLGHELGHFLGDDTLYSRKISPVYAAAGQSLGGLLATQGHWSGVISIPATLLLSAVFETLVAGVSEVSRSRELEADATAARVASAAALGRALRKLEATSWAYPETVQAAVAAAAYGNPIPDIPGEYARRARMAAAGAGAPERGIPHPFDTHPTLGSRLDNLGIPGSPDDALDLAPEPSAWSAVADGAAIDATLSSRLNGRVPERTGALGTTLPPGSSKTIRVAARYDTGIAAAIELVEDMRDGDLETPESRDGRWLTLADLVLEPYDDADRRRFVWSVPSEELPANDMLLVTDLAVGTDDPALVLAAGSVLLQVAASTDEQRAGKITEMALVGAPGTPAERQLVIVRGVGRMPARHQAAAFFVVPQGDILAATAGPIADDVQRAAAALRATRPRSERMPLEGQRG